MNGKNNRKKTSRIAQRPEVETFSKTQGWEKIEVLKAVVAQEKYVWTKCQVVAPPKEKLIAHPVTVLGLEAK